jgi:DNA-directed RNA polymerase subunit beta'
MVQKGEAAGVIAAQSIGEPGTQLTLRTFHVGGTASNIAVEASVKAKYEGVIRFEEIRSVSGTNIDGEEGQVVIGRTGQLLTIDMNNNRTLTTTQVPYGSFLKVKDGQKVVKGDDLALWDPYNAVILTEFAGNVFFDSIEENVTVRIETDETTQNSNKVIIETKDKNKNPSIRIVSDAGEEKSYNLPVGAILAVEDGDRVISGKILAKIPRAVGKTRDITGGLPRVTELFEARSPSNPAVVSEIDGVVSYGTVKRGNREIIVEGKDGVRKRYSVPLNKLILVQDNDFVKAGVPLSDGAITPEDILRIQGPSAVQQYLVNEIQEVYRLQGVKINDKHFEVVIRQMMRKVRVEDPGDTLFLEEQLIHTADFLEENDKLYGMKVVEDAGDSEVLKPGQIVSPRELRDENSLLKRNDKNQVAARDVITATATPVLQGITRASLQTKSFISAASFQETTKVLNEAAVAGKVDTLEGLKENVIVGHRIPAGTGMRDYDHTIVGSKEDYNEIMASKEEYIY